EEACLAGRPGEDVVLVQLDYGQPAPLCSQRVPRPGGLLLLDQQRVASGLPLGRVDDSGKAHRDLLLGLLSTSTYRPAGVAELIGRGRRTARGRRQSSVTSSPLRTTPPCSTAAYMPTLAPLCCA